MRLGCYDVHERVRDMNRNGIFASMNFPSFPKFAGQTFVQAEDKELAIACIRAFNDWTIDEWCGAYPDRLIPLCVVPFWDPHLVAQEIERIFEKGARAITFPENPVPLGFPSWHTDHWDPMLATCEELGIAICLHIGSSSRMPFLSREAPITVMLNLLPLNACQAAADLLWSPVPRKFPRIRSRSPKAERGGCRTCWSAPTSPMSTIGPGPIRTSGTSSRATSFVGTSSELLVVLHRRRHGTRPSRRRRFDVHHVRGRLSALRLDVAEVTPSCSGSACLPASTTMWWLRSRIATPSTPRSPARAADVGRRAARAGVMSRAAHAGPGIPAMIPPSTTTSAPVQ